MRLLIVEDEVKTGAYLQQGLNEAGFTVDVATTGEDGLHHATTSVYDLIILDIMLPGVNGFEILKKLRENGHVSPVIFLSAKDRVEDRVHGFELGADDYLVKPFSIDELLARVRALLRRREPTGANALLRVGDLTLDPARREVKRAERIVQLTKTEFDLLEALMLRAGLVVTREQLYEEIWGFDFETGSKSLDVYIGYLRRKTEEAGESRIVYTIRGVGYTVKA